MNSSQGLKESDFGVLDSQSDSPSVEHKIAIKKIYGNGFDNLKKPTDLILDAVPEKPPVVETPENTSEQLENSIEKSFEIPKPLLDYIDVLIVDKKLPLRTLKFDIEFAKSAEEIVGYIESYIKKSNIISEEDIDKLFGFVGGRENVESRGVSLEDVEKKEEVIGFSLDEFRTGYVGQLAPYLERLKKDKALYLKIMAELGGNTDMPIKDEPKELTEAREEYKNAKEKNGIVGIADELIEVEKLRTEVLKSLDIKLQSRLEKASISWDSYSNSGLVAEALLGDVDSLNKIVDPDSFDGMRAEVKPEIVSVEPIAEAKPEEVAVVEAKEPEIKFEIVGEGQKIEDEAKQIALGGEKPPVDSAVAEKVAEEQNSTALEYEGKKLEIVRGEGEDKDKMKLVWGGIEIAFGQITPKGTTIKIDRKFKSGFLLADTLEEKALKHAMPAIKAIKL